ncbi:MAG: hypothetical protein AAFX45_12500 [Pseudomonadota bacterium]
MISVMSDNIFTSVYDDPFRATEEWVPLLADNTNAPVGVDMPSFAAHRRVRVAAFFFNISKSRDPLVRRPAAALTEAGRKHAWVFSDPA